MIPIIIGMKCYPLYISRAGLDELGELMIDESALRFADERVGHKIGQRCDPPQTQSDIHFRFEYETRALPKIG